MLEHDFGTVLSHGQVLRHDFEVENRSDSPLVLLGGTATTPCCSSIGPLPQSVPARGRSFIPVSYKPGQRNGPGRVGFEVHAGPKGDRKIHLTLNAALVAEFEVEAEGEIINHLSIGQTTSQTLRVTCRRWGDQGLLPPSSVRASGGLEARFAGPPRREFQGKLAESRFDVEVDVLASGTIGRHEGRVEFGWPDGLERVHPIAWEVDPPVRIAPTALIVRSGDDKLTKHLTIRCDARPIAVRSVTGPLVAGYSSDPDGLSNGHQIRVELDPRRSDASSSSDVVIATDHPDQPRLVVSVLILPSTTNTER